MKPETVSVISCSLNPVEIEDSQLIPERIKPWLRDLMTEWIASRHQVKPADYWQDGAGNPMPEVPQEVWDDFDAASPEQVAAVVKACVVAHWATAIALAKEVAEGTVKDDIVYDRIAHWFGSCGELAVLIL